MVVVPHNGATGCEGRVLDVTEPAACMRHAHQFPSGLPYEVRPKAPRLRE